MKKKDYEGIVLVRKLKRHNQRIIDITLKQNSGIHCKMYTINHWTKPLVSSDLGPLFKRFATLANLWLSTKLNIKLQKPSKATFHYSFCSPKFGGYYLFTSVARTSVICHVLMHLFKKFATCWCIYLSVTSKITPSRFPTTDRVPTISFISSPCLVASLRTIESMLCTIIPLRKRNCRDQKKASIFVTITIKNISSIASNSSNWRGKYNQENQKGMQGGIWKMFININNRITEALKRSLIEGKKRRKLILVFAHQCW